MHQQRWDINKAIIIYVMIVFLCWELNDNSQGGARRGGVDYEFLRCGSSHIYTSPSRDIFIVTQPAIDLAKLLV